MGIEQGSSRPRTFAQGRTRSQIIVWYVCGTRAATIEIV